MYKSSFALKKLNVQMKYFLLLIKKFKTKHVHRTTTY